MEYFDYIGTGGFIIECQDGGVLGVTKQQSERMQLLSPFFHTCFQNDMVERQHSILRKPDWTLAVARYLVEILTKGQTALPSLELYQQVMEAGDQVLVDLRLCSFVNYQEPALHKEHRFLELVSDPDTYFCFTLKAVVTSQQWLQLLDQGIVLNRESTNYVVKLHSEDEELSAHQEKSMQIWDREPSEYLVYAKYVIQAMLLICNVLSLRTDSEFSVIPSLESGENERSCICFETATAIPAEHLEWIGRLAGREAYDRFGVSAVTYETVRHKKKTMRYTVLGSFDVLKRSMEPLGNEVDCCEPLNEQQTGPQSEDLILGDDARDSQMSCCMLIDNPTPDTLGRFVSACQLAKDFPGIIYFDLQFNRFFCRVSLRDLHIMVTYMGDYSTTAKICGPFLMQELSSEDVIHY